jgi:hypothetical protein
MKKSNLLKACVAALCLFSLSLPAQAKSKVFYDAKSNIIGVSGAYESVERYGYEEKLFENPVQISTALPTPADAKKGFSETQATEVLNSLNAERVGNKVLRYLFTNGGSSSQLSDDLLKQRALQNIQRGDLEFANENYKSASDVLREDYLPILAHNYIYLETKSGTDRIAYMVFHVCIDNEVLNDVYNTWENPAGLSKIDVPVELLAYSIEKIDDEYAKMNSSLAKNATAFAIRGQIIQRNPAKIDANSTNGVKKGDLVTVYNQQMDKEGQMYSKRISRARVCAVDTVDSRLYFVAGTRGNRKKGDIAVVTRDKRMAISVEGTWSVHNYGAQLDYDYQVGYTKVGLVHHALADIAISVTDKPSENFTINGSSQTFKSPVFANIGIGYGISKVFAGFLEVMPYFLVQGEAGIMFNKDSLKTDANSSDTKSITGIAFRAPVGVRLDFNIAYPWQITLTGGYAFNWGYNDDNDFYKSYAPIKEASELIGAKRNGLFLAAGIKWHF